LEGGVRTPDSAGKRKERTEVEEHGVPPVIVIEGEGAMCARIWWGQRGLFVCPLHSGQLIWCATSDKMAKD